ncbi:MAG TPA: M20/M25/M40 family metallo-hydrolase [Bacillota bacterium]|nr:M20/M25/M40 family metallo-hydrolase [Bacillota bacterium]
MQVVSADEHELRAELVREFCELVRVDSEPYEEAELADVVEENLLELGFEVERDDAGKKIGGNSGNLIARLPEAQCSREKPILLCAHLDRVPPGKGVKPRLKGDRIVSSGDTVLGADDVAGLVAILAGVRMARRVQSVLPPLEVVITVCEEKGLQGSRHLDYSKLQSKTGFVFDAARPVGVVIYGAPTHVKFEVDVIGRAAHAGINPEDGVSAIQTAAGAITRIPFGWVDDDTTANIGTVTGGEAMNIVCERVHLVGEVRSHDDRVAARVLKQIEDCFAEEARKSGAKAEFEASTLYKSYRIDENSEALRLLRHAIGSVGRNMTLELSNGGTDANQFNANGIESVGLGIGFEQAHSTRESITVEELVAATKLASCLILRS